MAKAYLIIFTMKAIGHGDQWFHRHAEKHFQSSRTVPFCH